MPTANITEFPYMSRHDGVVLDVPHQGDDTVHQSIFYSDEHQESAPFGPYTHFICIVGTANGHFKIGTDPVADVSSSRLMANTYHYRSVVPGDRISFVASDASNDWIPTNIVLSEDSLNEGNDSGAVVGVLSTADADIGDTFTYTLVAGTGSTDNASFSIDDDELKIGVVTDYVDKPTYSIRIRSTDAVGNYFENVFTITVLNVNEAPTDITIDVDEIAEGNQAGAIVGSFSTTDPDPADTFTYTLVAGIGSTDNAAFTIDGADLKLVGVADFESQATYNIRIRSTDQGGLYYEKALVITVADVNEAPTDIMIDVDEIAENNQAGAVVGTFSTTDEDAGDTFTYTLVAGTGDTDNAAFTIDGADLKITGVADYEAQPSYSIRVRSTDAGSLWFEKQLTISVTNVNEAPTDITIDVDEIAENNQAGAVVGIFSTTDVDAGDTFTYTLVAGTGDDDNAAFTIDGANLKLTGVADYEAQSSYSIRVRSTDAGLLWVEKQFTISVTNVNEAPTDIFLSQETITEGNEIGALVAILTTEDEDIGDTYLYELVPGTGSSDNNRFFIGGVNDDELKISEVASYPGSYNIRLRTTDSGALSYEKAFVITVLEAV